MGAAPHGGSFSAQALKHVTHLEAKGDIVENGPVRNKAYVLKEKPRRSVLTGSPSAFCRRRSPGHRSAGETGEMRSQYRLARAGRAKQRPALAGANVEGDIFDANPVDFIILSIMTVIDDGATGTASLFERAIESIALACWTIARGCGFI